MSFSFDGGGNADLAYHPAEDSNYYYSPQDNSVHVKQEPEFHMFGSNGSGLLDMLATVATQTLNNDVSLRNVKTRPLSPQADFKPDVKPFITPVTSSKPASCRNPRRLTDFDVFGFQQISKMSLNSLIRLFTETDFDEMRRVYRYRCALMPEDICRETIQSFGNENKAKQSMKSHLQGHIKNLLRHDQYQSFTAEPVLARQRRLAVESGGSFDISDVTHLSHKSIKAESNQIFMEKENSEVISKFNSRAKKRKFFEREEIKVTTSGPNFLTEISNEPASDGLIKRPRMDVAYYDPTTDVVIKCSSDEPQIRDELSGNSVTLKRHMKHETLEDEETTLRSTPSPGMELIPYDTLRTCVKTEYEREPSEVYDEDNDEEVAPFEISDDHGYFASSSSNSESVLTDSDQKSRFVELEEDQLESSTEIDLMELQRIVDSSRKFDNVTKETSKTEIIDISFPSIGAEIEVKSSIAFPVVTKKKPVSKAPVEVKKVAAPKPKLLPPQKEVEEVSEVVKEQALACIAELQAKGATTDDLTCRICDPAKSFTAYTTLLSHLRSHAQIRPYECTKCRAVFTRQHSLNYHLLIHANSTRFTCNDCGRKFRHPSHFKEHRRRHTGESPFSCDECDQKYKTRNTYKRHLKVQHGKILTASGSLTTLTSEEFARVQAAERKKEILVNGRTVCPKTVKRVKNDVETSPSNVVSVERLKKKVAEDDFIVDYHYGDSVSNDDEVARINAKLAEKQRRKFSVGEGTSQVTISSSTSDSSYYPSTNSEFSTPEITPSTEKDKEQPPPVKLPEFGARPPPGVSGVAMTVKKISEERTAVKEQPLQTKPVTVQLKYAPVVPQRTAIDPNPTNRIVTTKPAFLAQINGQQVLLIPGPNTTAVPVASASAEVHVPTVFSEPHQPTYNAPLQGQSKLEQCLRYGSAAVAQHKNEFIAKSSQQNISVQNTSSQQKSSFSEVIPNNKKGPVILRLPNNMSQSMSLNPDSKLQMPAKKRVGTEVVVVQKAADDNIKIVPPTTMTSQSLEYQPAQVFVHNISSGEGYDDRQTEFLVPEMVCEEEVVSCQLPGQSDEYAAEISVRIETSPPTRNPSQLYDPKYSPAVKQQHRDRILCDLLGINPS